jgi:AGCS family alanine or glycine:cation symporter
MEQFAALMDSVNGIVWGPAMIVFLVGTGLYLTFRLRFVQLRHLGHSIRCVSGKYDDPAEEGDISHFQALSAALSATIGTGNIAGVATAIAMGGPGAVFWMWVTALVGMATKFASCSLAIRYRIIHEDGTASGGPMYFLSQGLGQKKLAVLFALFAGLASFGIGCAVQSNSVVDGLLSLMPETVSARRLPETMAVIGGTPIVKPIIGIVLAVLVGVVIIGGIRRIAKVASRLVPIMSVIYIVGALAVLVRFAPGIPGAFAQIFRYAFTPFAVGGGFFGFVMANTIQKGVSRGVFSNESGLGSAPMAHAAAKTHEMAREGFVAMLGPLIDTLIICTMTALVIIVSGAWQVKTADGDLIYGPGAAGHVMKIEGKQVIATGGEMPEPYLDGDGEYYALPTSSSLTAASFERGLGRVGGWIVGIGIMLFAYSTMISWSYYGDRCWEYLLGPKAVKPYRYIFCLFVVIGTVSGLDLIWTIADNLNALMAIPNLIALIFLAGVVVREADDYMTRMHDQGDM